MGPTRPQTPVFTFSHLNALRAAMRIEAYGLYVQKWAEKPLGRPQTPSFVQSDASEGALRSH